MIKLKRVKYLTRLRNAKKLLYVLNKNESIHQSFNTQILTTHLSNFALGAILSQREIGNDLPITYASRTLNKHGIKKPVIEKQLLAIAWELSFLDHIYLEENV